MMMLVSEKEAVDLLEGGFDITLETDEFYFVICQTDCWLNGGMADGYLSNVLGDTVYMDAEDVLKQSIQHLEDKGEIVSIYC